MVRTRSKGKAPAIGRSHAAPGSPKHRAPTAGESQVGLVDNSITGHNTVLGTADTVHGAAGGAFYADRQQGHPKRGVHCGC